MKKLSIIIPVYNVEKYIEKCLLSCLHQDIPLSDYEIIVVNDGTPDNSMSIVEHIAKEHKNIRVISQENQGLSAARNAGLTVAEGEYIWYVDSDDWIAIGALSTIFSIIAEEKPDVIHFRAANVMGNEIKARTLPFADTERIYSGKEFFYKFYDTPCAPFYVCRRELINKYDLNFYPDVFHEDSEYTPRMLYRAKKVRVINDILYFVYCNPNSITRSVNYKKSFDRIVVADNLWNFCQNEVKEDYVQTAFYNDIATCLNTALHDSIGMPKEQEMEFNRQLYAHRHLFKSFWRSKRMRNRMEWLLFGLTSNYTGMYRLMQEIGNKK